MIYLVYGLTFLYYSDISRLISLTDNRQMNTPMIFLTLLYAKNNISNLSLEWMITISVSKLPFWLTLCCNRGWKINEIFFETNYILNILENFHLVLYSFKLIDLTWAARDSPRIVMEYARTLDSRLSQIRDIIILVKQTTKWRKRYLKRIISYWL